MPLYIRFLVGAVGAGFHVTICMSDTGEDMEMQARSTAEATSEHMLVCVLLELGSVLQDLGSTAAPLLHDTSIGQFATTIYILCMTKSRIMVHR